MVIHCYTRLNMAINGYTWLYMAINGYTGQCTGIHGNKGVYMALLSAREDNIRIPKRPCNVLFIYEIST